MPRRTRYHRLHAKHATDSVEENLSKRKQQSTRHTAFSEAQTAAIAKTTVQRAKTSPQNLTPQEMRQLQATIGNHALSRMIAAQPTQGHSVVSAAPVLQRAPIAVNQSAGPTTLVQRWKWPWRRGETDQQKLERYDKTKSNINTAIDVLRVGHGIVMLPLTVVDLISNIARPFTGNIVKPKQGGIGKKEENRKVFHNVLNGESQLVALMAGKNKYLDLKILKYMPWNIIPWIIGALKRWYDKVNKKYMRLNERLNN